MSTTVHEWKPRAVSPYSIVAIRGQFVNSRLTIRQMNFYRNSLFVIWGFARYNFMVFECPFVVFCMLRLYLLLDTSIKGRLVKTNDASTVKPASLALTHCLTATNILQCCYVLPFNVIFCMIAKIVSHSV